MKNLSVTAGSLDLVGTAANAFKEDLGLAGGLGVVAFCGLFLMYYALARD